MPNIVEYLEFTDGNVAIVINNNRRKHILMTPSIYDVGYSIPNLYVIISFPDCFNFRKLNVSYKQWRNRWAI